MAFNDRVFTEGPDCSLDTYKLGNVKLQGGGTIHNAEIAYKTFGDPKNEAILYPTWFTGFVSDNEWLIGEGMALDPTKYFIIICCAMGNGQSSSPSNTSEPYNGPHFPNVTLYDNVKMQHRLVTEHFKITKLALVTGWSMGAQQTYVGTGDNISTRVNGYSKLA